MNQLFIVLMLFSVSLFAQNPVGNWKKISHVGKFQGTTFDSHKALLSQRPCASKIVYRITADKNYRLDASTSGCDESYKDIQQRLWSKTKWRLQGNKFSTGTADFAVSNDYTISFSGDKMIWKALDSDDVITFVRLP